MKILAAIFGFIVKLFAGSFVWLIIAFVASFPSGFIVLQITDDSIVNQDALYFLYVLVCFIGFLIARVIAVSIKALADNKIAQQTEES
jgi:hypothetical protein